MLTDDEAEKVLLLQLYTAEKLDGRSDGVPTEEMEALYDWAFNARLNNALLNNLLEGNAYVRIRDRRPEFQITEKGRKKATP